MKQIVAAHELAHIVLHQSQLKIAPMKDTVLYNMASQTEYEANLFAADLLLDDEEIHKLSQDEDMDYFNMCKSLYVTPDFMSFKLFIMNIATIQDTGRDMEKLTYFHVPSKYYFLSKLTASRNPC